MYLNQCSVILDVEAPRPQETPRYQEGPTLQEAGAGGGRFCQTQAAVLVPLGAYSMEVAPYHNRCNYTPMFLITPSLPPCSPELLKRTDTQTHVLTKKTYKTGPFFIFLAQYDKFFKIVYFFCNFSA